MNTIFDAAKAFEKILGIEYEIRLGRKGCTEILLVSFEKTQFFHLAGMQYLADRIDILRSRRDVVFDKILSGEISVNQIESSAFYSKIKDRVEFLQFLESIMDSNDTIFRYNQRLQNFSLIQADFLMKNTVQSHTIFTFLAQDKKNGTYFCRSFFPQTNKDYSEKQTKWILLYKKKIFKEEHTHVVLFDKIKK